MKASKKESKARGRDPELVRKVAEAILLYPDLSPTQKNILTFLWLRYGNGRGQLWPANKRIAQHFRIHERKVRGHIDQMVEAGVIEKERCLQDDGRFGNNLLTLDIEHLLGTLDEDGSDAHPNPVPEQFMASVTELPRVSEQDPEGVSEQTSPAAYDRPVAQDRPQAVNRPSVQRPMTGRTEPGNKNQGEKQQFSTDADATEATDARASDPPLRVELDDDPRLYFRQDLSELVEASSVADRQHLVKTTIDILTQDPTKGDAINRVLEEGLSSDMPSLHTMTARMTTLLPQDPEVLAWLG